VITSILCSLAGLFVGYLIGMINGGFYAGYEAGVRDANAQRDTGAQA